MDRVTSRPAEAGFTARQWRRVGAFAAAILVLHLIGFGVLLSTGALAVGVGVTAYVLGMRHAFDADHIAAIDNTTRKLTADGQRPLGVGFFFSLGHSTVVFALAALLAVGVHGLGGAVGDDGSSLQRVTGLIGPSVSGLFLVLIGVLNLIVLVSIARILRRMRTGDFAEAELEAQLHKRGFLNRIHARASSSITRSWQMYPLGVLFGLGFDTATEIALLASAGTAAAGGLPWYAILCLPVLFAAGMSLLDTLDGAFMSAAYGWTGSKPGRRIFYNLTITALSVVVALLIGTIELTSVLADRLSLSGFPWDQISAVDLDHAGYAIAAGFVITWIVAAGVWRLGRIEERWSGLG